LHLIMAHCGDILRSYKTVWFVSSFVKKEPKHIFFAQGNNIQMERIEYAQKMNQYQGTFGVRRQNFCMSKRLFWYFKTEKECSLSNNNLIYFRKSFMFIDNATIDVSRWNIRAQWQTKPICKFFFVSFVFYWFKIATKVTQYHRSTIISKNWLRQANFYLRISKKVFHSSALSLMYSFYIDLMIHRTQSMR